MFECKVIADSRGPNGVRLTTMAVTTWKMIVAEFNTHRMLSRNSASSRAIPAERVMTQIKERPYVPQFRKNQRGMQPGEALSEEHQQDAIFEWLMARDRMVKQVEELNELGVHKQWVNRLLEPWMETTILVSATEWENFFALRCHSAAQDEIRLTAEAMRRAMEESEKSGEVKRVAMGEWHRPFEAGSEEVEAVMERLQPELTGFNKKGYTGLWTRVSNAIAVGRCATVSYDCLGEGKDAYKDYERAERLRVMGHLSPFEHVAMAIEGQKTFGSTKDKWSGNFRGWSQLRKHLPHEEVFQG